MSSTSEKSSLLADRYPHLLEEWDYEKNIGLDPYALPYGSNFKVDWKCSKGHSWQAIVKSRTTLSNNCPYCAGQRPVKGVNDLATTHPSLLDEWDYEKNTVSLDTIMRGTNKKVWWKCREGHSWEAKVNSRAISGNGCPHCAGKILTIGKNDLEHLYPYLLKEWDYTNNTEVTPSTITAKSAKRVWWKCNKGHSWLARVADRTYHSSACPECSAKSFVSNGEKELLSFVKDLDSSALGSYRKLAGVSEVDIFVPSSNIAVEFNGLYWHSEAKKSKDYHYKKWLACKEQGVQLLQIWEDEWRDRSAVIESLLAHKLGKSTEQRVYARNTLIKEVLTQDATTFLEQNHIQGSVGGSIRVGLFHNEELVALGLFRRRSDHAVELVRYATSCHVVGGQGKILKHLKKTYPQYKKVVTFADHCVSDGGLYEKLGFVNDGLVPPDYKYLVNGRLEHKFNYRIKRFKDDPALHYEEGLSERQLAKLNGLLRVYDAGKTRYVLYL